MKKLALVLLLLALVPGAATSANAPGVTSDSVLIGGTLPLSGPASAFGVLGAGANAYFRYVNDRGGVNGRKIRYLYVDDGYDVSRTVQETRDLVQDKKVFAIFNSVGTEHNLAVRPYLNQLKVPQLFVGSGATSIARNHARYPWTLGYLPSFAGEGAIYARYILRTKPRARIAVLYESSEYGKDLYNGFRSSLGRKSGMIVARQTYDNTQTDVRSQISKLRRSRANTLMVFALPPFAIQSYAYAYRLKWRPQFFVSSVSIEPSVMTIARFASSAKQTEGSVSVAFLKDPTSPRWAKDRAVLLYRKIMRRYYRSGNPKNVYNYYGMAVAFTMVDALRKAGRNLTRAGLLRAATHLNERNNPFMLPGIFVRTSPRNYFPIAKSQLVRYEKGRWRLFGRLVNAR
jgi:branched-chain amino acid transport system substrate-binding protein